MKDSVEPILNTIKTVTSGQVFRIFCSPEKKTIIDLYSVKPMKEEKETNYFCSMFTKRIDRLKMILKKLRSQQQVKLLPDIYDDKMSLDR